MTCNDCEAIQTLWEGEASHHVPAIYVRVGAANVQILACRMHAAILINSFRTSLEGLLPTGKEDATGA